VRLSFIELLENLENLLRLANLPLLEHQLTPAVQQPLTQLPVSLGDPSYLVDQFLLVHPYFLVALLLSSQRLVSPELLLFLEDLSFLLFQLFPGFLEVLSLL